MKSALKTLMLLLSLVVLTACGGKQSPEDVVEDILRNVPKNAEFVVVVNGSQVLDKNKITIENGEYVFSDELNVAIDKVKSVFGENKKSASLPYVGLNENMVLYFADGNIFLSAKVEDKELLMSYFEKTLGEKFCSSEGFEIDANNEIFIKDKLMWICVFSSQDASIIELIKDYTNLDKDKSFVGHPYFSELSEMKKDLYLMIDAKRMFKGEEGLMTNAFLSLFFKDANYLVADFNCEENRIVSSSKILDSEGKMAQAKITGKNVDGNVLKYLEYNNVSVQLNSVSPKFMKGLSDMAGVMLSQIVVNDVDENKSITFEDWAAAIGDIHGTFGFGLDFDFVNFGEDLSYGISLAIPFKDIQAANKAKKLLEEAMKANVNSDEKTEIQSVEKYIIANFGNMPQNKSTSNCDDEIKDCVGASFLDFTAFPKCFVDEIPAFAKLNALVVKQQMKDEGIIVNGELRFCNDVKNPVVALIEIFADFIEYVNRMNADASPIYTSTPVEADDTDLMLPELEPVDSEIYI